MLLWLALSGGALLLISFKLRSILKLCHKKNTPVRMQAGDIVWPDNEVWVKAIYSASLHQADLQRRSALRRQYVASL